jgi:hypothetical protein
LKIEIKDLVADWTCSLYSEEKVTHFISGLLERDYYYKADADIKTDVRDNSSVISISRLGGVVVSVIANGPKGCGFEPG